MSAESNFTEAVANFTHGIRFNQNGNGYLSVVRKGLIARNGDANAVADYIMQNAPTPAPDPAKLWSNISFALSNQLPDQPTRQPNQYGVYLNKTERAEARRLLLPKSSRDFVPVTLRNYSATAFTRHATADVIAESVRLSDAELHLDDAAYRRQASTQLRAMFRPGEKVWAGMIVKDEAVRKRLGIHCTKTPIQPEPGVRNGIIEAHVLADYIETGILESIPTHVSLNPVTGCVGTTSKCEPSFDCAETIAAYRHVIVEWDELHDVDAQGVKVPSQTHFEIVAGLLDFAAETDKIRTICAVYTGGKSVHVALRVKAADRGAYEKQTNALKDNLASADDKTFRVDTTGWENGYTHIRLAGGVKPETGRRARLIYCQV